MKVRTIGIDADVEAVIRAARLDGNALHLEGQLDRKLYTKTMKVLGQIGFKWDKKLKFHVGDGQSAMALREALQAGKVVDEKKTYQFFPTPKTLAARMAALANIGPGDRVLEPSAGDGAIVRAIQQECPHLAVVFAIELNPKMTSELRLLAEASRQSGRGNVVVMEEDFLDHGQKYDKIVMNPPFTANQDVDHVLHAYKLLLPGGILVAIMSKAWQGGTQKKQRDFRDWYGKLQREEGLASAPEEIEAGAFRESGTEVPALLVVIRKPRSSAKSA